ncbi:MAG: hypothetical protein HY566_02510 [Candidatus Kerfeldbacteria bacterium]|nr:hypothetical protein [Candidatus Kerfeldbacteria bacterium]
MLGFAAPATPGMVIVTADRPGDTRPAPHIQYPNTPAGEEFGDMPWIVRNGTVLRAIYQIKDRNEGNTLWIEEITLFAKNDLGAWFAYDGASWPPCSAPIGSDYWNALVDIDLTRPEFDGYGTGEQMEFRWYVRFRDAGCFNFVEKNQYFQVIKGEPLPLFAGQYAANLHTHSFYTDNVGEWGGAPEMLTSSAMSVDLDIVLWTDHGYDFSSAECEAMTVFARSHTTSSFLLIPGVEGHIDNDDDNDFPDGFFHTLTNVCVRTPIEGLPGAENSSTQLWTLAQFANVVASAGGYWAAAHPFAARFLPGLDVSSYLWSDTKVDEALARGAFLGFQGWNRHRSSMQQPVDTDNINPYPWTVDPAALDDLRQSIHRRDESQQRHLMPLRRAPIFAGTDSHGGYAYALERDHSPSIVVNNNALGKCMTVVELPSLSEPEVFIALLGGVCYTTSGPACRFGVDRNNDGALETTFGSRNSSAQGSVLRLMGKSNNEFGPFTGTTLHIFTPTTHDSIALSFAGMNPAAVYPVSSLPTGPCYVRAELATAGGYGDAGIVLTGDLYFNVAEPTDALDGQDAEPSLKLLQNPSRTTLRCLLRGPLPQHVALISVSGRALWAIDHPAQRELDVPVAGLPSGVYLIECRMFSGKRVSEKFVVLH